MFGSILILFLLPWLDTSRVRSGAFRPIFKLFFWFFVLVCFGLGYAGSQPAEGWVLRLGQFCTLWYFLHFLVILPLLGWFERPRALPISISQPVLGGGRMAGVAAAARPMEKA